MVLKQIIKPLNASVKFVSFHHERNRKLLWGDRFCVESQFKYRSFLYPFTRLYFTMGTSWHYIWIAARSSVLVVHLAAAIHLHREGTNPVNGWVLNTLRFKQTHNCLRCVCITASQGLLCWNLWIWHILLLNAWSVKTTQDVNVFLKLCTEYISFYVIYCLMFGIG